MPLDIIPKIFRGETKWLLFVRHYINGLVQDCSNSSVLAMELLQSCIKPSISFQKFVETETQWLLFVGQHFQINFLKWKMVYFDSNFADICTQGSIISKPPLYKTIAWHQKRDKPLSEPDVYFTDVRLFNFDETCINLPQEILYLSSQTWTILTNMKLMKSKYSMLVLSKVSTWCFHSFIEIGIFS